MSIRSLGYYLTGAALVLLLIAAPLRAADFTATTWQQLITAVAAANDETANPGADTISLENAQINVDAATAPAEITSDITIINGILDGSSAGSSAVCCVMVYEYGNATLDQLTIENCTTQDGAVVVTDNGSLAATDCSFQNNTATTDSGMYPYDITYYGGAITCWGGAVELTDCVLAGNHAVIGGAIAVTDPPWVDSPSSIGSLIATDCTFDGNDADMAGGAIATNKTVQATGCIFAGNIAGQAGGAIFNYDIQYMGSMESTGTLTLSGCTFSGNCAQLNTFSDNINGPGALGGAVLCLGSGTATNCQFIANWASASHSEDSSEDGSESDESVLAIGGALITLGDFACCNCAFIGNSVFGENTSEQGYVLSGGGAWAGLSTSMIGGSTNPTLALNCTFYGNSIETNATTINYDSQGIPRDEPNTTTAGGGMILAMGEVYNSILWGNLMNGESNQFSDLTEVEDFAMFPPATVCNSDIQGGWDGGVNILDADPSFVGAPEDLSLGEDSPCIDAGYTDKVTELGLTTDLAGNPRVVNEIVDLGAYEYQLANQPPELTVPATTFTVIAGNKLEFTATATDPDEDDDLTFSLENAPDGAQIDPETGVFSWTPTTVGTFSFDVKVTDAGGLSDSETVTVTVESALNITVTSIVRNGKIITVTVTISNPRATTAYNTAVTAATLNGSATNSVLPLLYGAIKPGTSKKCMLQFKNVTPGAWPLTVEGTCSLGLIYTKQTVTVP